MAINVFGILESDSADVSCPVCGEPLGYYAEFGDTVECYECGCKMNIDREIIFHYEIYEVGKGYKVNNIKESPLYGAIERVDLDE